MPHVLGAGIKVTTSLEDYSYTRLRFLILFHFISYVGVLLIDSCLSELKNTVLTLMRLAQCSFNVLREFIWNSLFLFYVISQDLCSS